MRYLIKFSYNGSKFKGFQKQKDRKTVQGELEKALSIINKDIVLIKGAGRTDADVHAIMQCAHFDLQIKINPERLIIALNNIVHPYINVIACKIVDNFFHARFCVKEKKYIYKIWLGDFSPLREDYYLQYGNVLNLEKLKECAQIFIGSYNFRNFVSGFRDNYKATIYDIEIKQIGEEVQIIFTGKSFYRYMVRNLVGAMLDFNEGKCDMALLEAMLKNKDYIYQLSTAPARGLYLEGVYYDDY